MSRIIIATKGLSCTCGKTFVSTDARILDQLPYHIKDKFPAVLTASIRL
jgi:energy-converting hydrogenase Eha subunit F